MKKLIICAALLVALASCKKQTPEAPSKMVTIKMTCESCRVAYSYGDKTFRESVTGSLVVTFRADVGSFVNTSMRLNKIGSMTYSVATEQETLWFRQTGDGYMPDMLFYSSVVIK